MEVELVSGMQDELEQSAKPCEAGQLGFDLASDVNSSSRVCWAM
jgi:hypothetical protein